MGVSWKFKVGGGFVVGQVNGDGEMSGNGIAYVYPDHKTSIVGHFERGQLVSGAPADLVDVKWDENRIPVPIFAKTKQPTRDLQWEPANQTYLGPNPLQRDFYEDQYLCVKNSTLGSKAGRGVFLKQDARAGQVVGFYNGVRLNGIESKLKVVDRKSPYRMDNDWAVEGQVLNMPPGYRELNEYNATLGHLINHSKDPNAAFSMFDHPRFGKIRSIELIKDVKEGQELFCDYGYTEKYVNTVKAVQSLYKFGHWLSNKKEDEYRKDLKHHIHYVKNIVNQYKPVLNILASAIGS